MYSGPLQQHRFLTASSLLQRDTQIIEAHWWCHAYAPTAAPTPHTLQCRCCCCCCRREVYKKEP